MAIKINNATYQKFTQFADEAGTWNTLAQLKVSGEGADQSRDIVVSEMNDSVRKLFRSQTAKDANDAVRELFRKTVYSMFGGENRVPKSVKSAMRLGDYGQGKPLTARRINAVRIAIAAAVEKENMEIANVKLATDFSLGTFDKLPEDFQIAAGAVVDEIKTRGGAAMLPDLKKGIPRMVDGGGLEKTFRALKHPVTVDEFKGIIRANLAKALSVEREKILEYAKGLFGKSPTTNFAASLLQAHPKLRKALAGCRSAADFEAVLPRYERLVREHYRLMGWIESCKERLADMLVAEYSDANLLTKEQIGLVAKRQFQSIVGTKLGDEILNGKIKVKTEADIEQVFRDAAKDYVRQRVEVSRQAASVKNIPLAVRENLRITALVAESVKEYRIADFAPLASELDLTPIRKVFANGPAPVETVAQAVKALCGNIVEIGKRNLGAAKWLDLGVDGQQPFVNILLKVALANDKELARALNEKPDEFSLAVSNILTKKEGEIQSVNSALFVAIGELATAFD